MLRIDCVVDGPDGKRLANFSFITEQVDDRVAGILALGEKMKREQYISLYMQYQQCVQNQVDHELGERYVGARINFLIDRIIH